MSEGAACGLSVTYSPLARRALIERNKHKNRCVCGKDDRAVHLYFIDGESPSRYWLRLGETPVLPANTPTAHSFLGTFYGTWLLWKLYRIVQGTIDKIFTQPILGYESWIWVEKGGETYDSYIHLQTRRVSEWNGTWNGTLGAWRLIRDWELQWKELVIA